LSVDVPLDDVAGETGAGLKGALEVDSVAFGELA